MVRGGGVADGRVCRLEQLDDSADGQQQHVPGHPRYAMQYYQFVLVVKCCQCACLCRVVLLVCLMPVGSSVAFLSVCVQLMNMGQEECIKYLEQLNKDITNVCVQPSHS